jgi:hypothetical protein
MSIPRHPPGVAARLLARATAERELGGGTQRATLRLRLNLARLCAFYDVSL